MTPRSLADAAGIWESRVTKGELEMGGVHSCVIFVIIGVLGVMARVVLRVLYTSAVDGQMTSLFRLWGEICYRYMHMGTTSGVSGMGLHVVT